MSHLTHYRTTIKLFPGPHAPARVDIDHLGRPFDYTRMVRRFALDAKRRGLTDREDRRIFVLGRLLRCGLLDAPR